MDHATILNNVSRAFCSQFLGDHRVCLEFFFVKRQFDCLVWTTCSYEWLKNRVRTLHHS